jgi:hypothetical protein
MARFDYNHSQEYVLCVPLQSDLAQLMIERNHGGKDHRPSD